MADDDNAVNVVAVGASAGGLKALMHFVAGLVHQPDTPARTAAGVSDLRSAGNYHCHVGHAWSADALLGARDDETEGALWVAMRSLQEKAKLSRRLAAQVEPGILREKYEALADEADRARSVIGDRLTHAYSRHREPND